MPFVVDLGGLEAKPTPCASFAPQPPELILAGWPESPERVADFRRIGWPVCSGLGGRFQPECSCDFERYNAAVSAAVISEPVAEVMPEQWLIRSCSGM